MIRSQDRRVGRVAVTTRTPSAAAAERVVGREQRPAGIPRFGREARDSQGGLALAAVAAALAFPSSATGDVASATQFAESRAGTVSFAYLDSRRRLHGYQPNLRYRSASLVKAMMLVAYLRRVSWGRLPLDRDARARLGPMITVSDNIAGNWAYDRIGRGSTLDALDRRVSVGVVRAPVGEDGQHQSGAAAVEERDLVPEVA